MSHRSEISPDTLSVSLEAEGVGVEYSDGRTVFYHGVPDPVESVRTPPGKQVHVLVTDPTETEGVMVYVNDRKTADGILRDSGVGRVLLEQGEETSLFPGVTVRETGYRIEVEADPEVARGRVFVFAEDELGEQSWEIVGSDGETDDDGQETGGATGDTAAGGD
jgi:hypothetical protein